MGCPVVEAPCEAEAQCAALAQQGLVYASATEDMDCLTFKSPVLLRKMTFASGKAADVQVITYAKILTGLNITHDMFVDLCILLGCDYCDSIRGIGPKTALKLIREHKCIENILKHIDRKKHVVPHNWVPDEEVVETDSKMDAVDEGNEEEEEEGDKKPAAEEEVAKEEATEDGADENKSDDANTTTPTAATASKPPATSSQELSDEEKIEPVYVQARRLFNHHEVLIKPEIKWTAPLAKELKAFLCDEMGFNPERVDGQIANLQKAFKANAQPQMHMDSFFGAKAAPNSAALAKKREAEKAASKGKGAAKKAKTGGAFFKKK
jgi:flap endonuclease-1